MPRLKAALLLSLATLCAPAFSQSANQAGPGTLNYVEGQVMLNGQVLNSSSVGSAEVQPGQVLETGKGKAEVLLTPGVFLRLGDNSGVRMISPSLTDTVVQLDHGRADVEVDQIYKQNHIVVEQKGNQTLLVRTGLYAFDASKNTVSVFDGKAAVFAGASTGASGNLQPAAISESKPVEVKGGRQLTLNADMAKPVSFDKNRSQDDLYNWSSLRSEYLGEANVNLASAYGGYGGFNPGWFWDSGLYGYTWLPGGGPFFSPFGFGFYSPGYLYGGGLIYGGRGGYGYGRGYGFRPGGARGAVSGARAGSFAAGGGFHSGGGMGGGGGFHGGGGGGGHR